MKVIVFSEGYFEEIYDYATLLEARAFSRGVGCGSQLYAGAGNAYVLPEDEEEMYDTEDPTEIARAMDALSNPPTRT